MLSSSLGIIPNYLTASSVLMLYGRCMKLLASILQACFAAIFAFSQNGNSRFKSVLHLDNANDLIACTFTAVQLDLSSATSILFEILLVDVNLVEMKSLTLPDALNMTPRYLYSSTY